MLDSEVAEVAVGSQHTALLTVAGTVFTMGRNLEGQLGVNKSEIKLDLHPTVKVGGRTAQPGLVPVTRLADHRLVALAAGADFTLALAGGTLPTAYCDCTALYRVRDPVRLGQQRGGSAGPGAAGAARPGPAGGGGQGGSCGALSCSTVLSRWW